MLDKVTSEILDLCLVSDDLDDNDSTEFLLLEIIATARAALKSQSDKKVLEERILDLKELFLSLEDINIKKNESSKVI